MKKILSILTLLIITVTFFGCAETNKTNTLKPEVDEISLTSLGTIDLSEEMETLDLWAVYPKGIIIISLSEKFIKVFDFEGNLVADLFKEGEGPGEFLAPTPIFIHEDRDEIDHSLEVLSSILISTT